MNNLSDDEKKLQLKTLATRVKISYLLLLILVVAWHSFITELPVDKRLTILIIWLLPLMLPIRGVLTGQGRASAWLTVISLLYLFHGVLIILDPGQRILAFIEIVLSLNLYWQAFIFGKRSGFRKKREKKSKTN